jgi:hypothetical protein
VGEIIDQQKALQEVDDRQRKNGERRSSAKGYYSPKSINRRHEQAKRQERIKRKWNRK